MPKTKKQPYIFFCEERRQTDPNLKGMKLPELVEACSQAWTSLNADVRDRYVQMAKEFNECGGFFGAKSHEEDKDDEKLGLKGRFDCLGRSLLAIHQQSQYEKCKPCCFVIRQCLRISHLQIRSR